MKIEEQVLSREQMARLKELGVDTSDASMYWIVTDKIDKKENYTDSYPHCRLALSVPTMIPEHLKITAIPTYTIGDLIEKLSLLREKRYGMEIIKVEDGSCSVQHPFWGIRYDKTVILSLYHTLCEITEHNNRKPQRTN